MRDSACGPQRGVAQTVKHRRKLEGHKKQRAVDPSPRCALPSQRSACEVLENRQYVHAVTDRRAIGTILDPKGKALAAISKGEAFYGDIDILGKPYTTGYEPIRDSAKTVIGIYYVGYLK